MLRLAGRDQLRDDRAHGIRRDRKADTLIAARVALDLRVMPITLPARLNSGPPELPWLIAASVWIAPSIGVLSGAAISRFTRADDAGRDGVVETERIADRNDTVSDRNGARVSKLERRELRRRSVDVQDGDVGRRVTPDDRRGVGRAVRELDADRACTVDHVSVRDDVALGVVDEARPLGGGAPPPFGNGDARTRSRSNRSRRRSGKTASRFDRPSASSSRPRCSWRRRSGRRAVLEEELWVSATAPAPTPPPASAATLSATAIRFLFLAMFRFLLIDV